MAFALPDSVRGLGNVPLLTRRLISCRDIPQSLTASLMGISALLCIIKAAMTCASNSALMLLVWKMTSCMTDPSSVCAQGFHSCCADCHPCNFNMREWPLYHWLACIAQSQPLIPIFILRPKALNFG